MTVAAERDLRPVLELEGIVKRFGAVTALRGVDLTLGKGEVLGLVGDNGAGKSTLVSVISGIVRPDEGELRVDGREQSFSGPLDAREAGIETVFQSLGLIPTLDIASNVFLNRERFRAGALGRALRWLDKSAMRRDVDERLSGLGLRLPAPTTKVAALSGGQRQAVAIARAVIWGGHIVVMDEPAAALGVHQTEIVLSFIERLKDHGVAVILVSHNMVHVLRVCDRVAVMRLGRVVFESTTAQTSGRELVEHITGAL
jgi:ABC-type sugar transport system ATPase subunit